MAKKKSSLKKFKNSIKPDNLGRVKGNDTLTHRKMKALPDTKGFTPLPCITGKLAKEIADIPVK